MVWHVWKNEQMNETPIDCFYSDGNLGEMAI